MSTFDPEAFQRAPAPPEYLLQPEAKAAWLRIHANLARRGEWDDLYSIATAHAASGCAQYMLAARLSNVPSIVERLRLQAREMLAEMHYIARERVNLAPLTVEGLDEDLCAVCAPLEQSK